MCEAYNEIGMADINVTHIVNGGANFFVVALGGTIIGMFTVYSFSIYYYIIIKYRYSFL